ncbi:MAG: T9SS type A sorting domain-containing protein [Sphingobacteriaceae bacterium]|nr:T9SS type A sorting domain-containing protein [Sphingobacteriaceae bacterium]
MKIAILAFLAVFCSYAQAQISITRAEMPQNGDTVRVMNAIVPPNLGVRLAATGPGYSWDFSDLQPDRDELFSYRLGIQTPYFYFLTAYGTQVQENLNLFVVNLEQLYDFYNLNNNRFAVTGKGFTVTGLPLPAFFTDPDEVFFLPLTYNRRDSSTFAFSLSIPTVGDYRSRGGRKTEVDGWGTVKTPQGTFECLRVKSTVRTLDSITFNGLNIGIPLRTEVQYIWLAKGEKAPILKATGTSFFGQFTPTTVQYRYNAPVLVPPIKVPVEAGKVLLYPNPVSEILYLAVNGLDRIEAVQIFDEFGRLVKVVDGSPAAGIDVRDLQSGLYSVRVYGQYGVYTEKLVVTPR